MCQTKDKVSFQVYLAEVRHQLWWMDRQTAKEEDVHKLFDDGLSVNQTVDLLNRK